MKHLITLTLFLFLSFKLWAQTDGISYQAVIIGPDALELPGVDSEGNYLPNATVDIKFVIYDSGNQIEYQEIQTTNTDEFGRINLTIGAVKHDEFETISWDGTSKDLKVEIDFKNGNGFIDMSREQLTFVPYAYHRNITATGTLDVDDDTFLNRELTVDGPTTLNSTLLVSGENATDLTGDLRVGGETNLNDNLTVEGQTNLNDILTVEGETNINSSLLVNNKSTTSLSGALTVGESTGLGVEDVYAPTILNGTLNVAGKATVGDFEATGESAFNELIARTLIVNESSELNGNTIINGNTTISDTLNISVNTQIKIRATLNGDDESNIDDYPLLVEGGAQGIAIKVNGSRNNSNNFMSFWDTSGGGTMWGRIEGETEAEFANDAGYLFEKASLNYDIFDAEVDLGFAIADEVLAIADGVATALDFRVCVGLGGCLASPGPADIAFSLVEIAAAAVNIGFASEALVRANNNDDEYDVLKLADEGITFTSGAGDYAEYLLRSDVKEKMTYGDIVGVVGGKISKNTEIAERLMVVSFKPIVLGNMPKRNREKEYEKVAFMGQVPVKVYGKVNIGDYILPSLKNDGIGIALSPDKITSKNIKNIVGVAWSESKKIKGFNLVNVAVGLNKNDNNPIVEKLENKVKEQAKEIDMLKTQIADIYELLSGNENSLASNQSLTTDDHEEAEESTKGIYNDRKYEIIDTPKGEAIYWEITTEDFEKGLEMAEDQMRLNGIDVDNHILFKKFKNNPNYKNEVINQINEKLDKQFHYHKEIDKNGGH